MSERAARRGAGVSAFLARLSCWMFKHIEPDELASAVRYRQQRAASFHAYMGDPFDDWQVCNRSWCLSACEEIILVCADRACARCGGDFWDGKHQADIAELRRRSGGTE